MRFFYIACILLLVACSGPSKKEYSKLEPIANKVDIVPLWVAKVGEKSSLEHRQLSVDVDGDRVYVANAKGKVSALQQQDGKVIWSKPLGVSMLSGPKYDDGVLYVGSEARLYALDANSGEILWVAKVSSEILSDPTVSGSHIFLQTIDEKLYALDKKSGEKIWVNSREVPALTLRGTSSPVVINQRVIAGFADGKLAAFDVNAGDRIWEVTVAVASGRTDLQRMVDIDGLLKAGNNEIYVVSYQGRIAAISAQNGEAIWSREMSSYTGVALDKQQLYVTDAGGHVWAIDRGTGATLWRQDGLENRDVTGPVVFEDMVVIADGAGWVHWLSKEDGGFVSRKDLSRVYDAAFFDFGDENRKEFDFGVSNDLKVADNKVYIRNNVGALSVFQLSSAQQTN